MAKVEVILTKPLNGNPVGSKASYDERDVPRLEKLAAVRRVKKARAPANKMAPVPENK